MVLQGGGRGAALFVLPSPLLGEGGEIERSEIEPGEGSVSADRDPSPALASRVHPLPQGERVRIENAGSDNAHTDRKRDARSPLQMSALRHGQTLHRLP